MFYGPQRRRNHATVQTARWGGASLPEPGTGTAFGLHPRRVDVKPLFQESTDLF